MRRTIDRTNELREAIASTSSAPAPSRPTSPAARDTWVETATLTAGTLHQVSVFLRGIRQVYLSHSPKGKAPQQQRGDLDFSKGLLGVKASEWKFMSERERDEVDIQVKGILRATLAKIKQLESIEARALFSQSLNHTDHIHRAPGQTQVGMDHYGCHPSPTDTDRRTPTIHYLLSQSSSHRRRGATVHLARGTLQAYQLFPLSHATP